MITGALTGIGRATAMAFAHEGARVVVSGRRDEAGKALATELRTLGVEAEFVLADVRQDDEVRSLVDQTVKRFGRLDVAVNNAGTEGHLGPVTEQSADSYAATFDTNVLGTLLSLKHELRVMVAQGHGSIVNLSSALGQIGAPGMSVYSASKHAIEGLTKSAALEIAGSGVRVNAVAPGPIETEMLNRFTGSAVGKAGLVAGVPAKRTGTPEEIAQTIVFLASDKAPFLTGQSGRGRRKSWARVSRCPAWRQSGLRRGSAPRRVNSLQHDDVVHCQHRLDVRMRP
jgi:NAD(P)-dependent dehydrogenase (short-subunit alcohol dehydrogenase family)